MKRLLLLLSGLLALVGLGVWYGEAEWGLAGVLLKTYAQVFLLIALGVLGARALRLFLWRVSRRLAFSYFLFGIVPITLLALLSLVTFYFLGGFFMGHLYRDQVHGLAQELQTVAEGQLAALRHRHRARVGRDLPVDFAYYKNGQRYAGSRAAPGRWQEAWEDGGDWGWVGEPTLFAKPDGTFCLMGAARQGSYGVVAVWNGDLARELADRSGIWVEFFRPEDRSVETFDVDILRRRYSFKVGREAAPDEIEGFLQEGVEEPGLGDQPWFVWAEIWRPFVDLATLDDGVDPEAFVYANLTTSPRILMHHLISRSVEIDALALVSLAVIAFLLFDIYFVSALLALVMISGLSRAVDRLTDATERVQAGDFGARIDVQRKDQIGALQESFNAMSSSLGNLVEQAAQKEILEKDLSIAKELQQSLLPDTLSAPSSLRFATHFEPSSAIGGDYYDLLETADGGLAVVVADAAGHGISAGLRMAMVKAALQVLCERDVEPKEVLAQVHRFLRAGVRSGQRSFVTLTLAVVDLSRGRLTLFNAGHLPTYVLRRGTVREVLLPSPPLGTFSAEHPSTVLELEAGDVVVWLSDGLVEALNVRGEVFGFERVLSALNGVEGGAEAARDRLLEALHEHTGEFPLEDDRTVVAMAYEPEASVESSASLQAGNS